MPAIRDPRPLALRPGGKSVLDTPRQKIERVIQAILGGDDPDRGVLQAVAPLAMVERGVKGVVGAAKAAREPITDVRRLLALSRRPAEMTPGQLGTVSSTGKPFIDQAYPSIANVRVWWDDPADVIYDQVKGLNPGHALTRAGANWPSAALVELLGSSLTKR